MLNSTYSADSVRGWRGLNLNVGNFVYLGLVNGSNNYYRYQEISSTGDLIIIPSITTSLSNYLIQSNTWTTDNIRYVGEASNSFSRPFAVNGTGNIIINSTSTTSVKTLVVNSLTSNFNYTVSANANIGNFNVYDISSDYTGNTIGIVKGNNTSSFVEIYNYANSSLTLEANIDLTSPTIVSTAQLISINESGNYIAMSNDGSNIQIFNKSGNVWSREANINISGNGCQNLIINNYGNVLVANDNLPSLTGNNASKVYTKSGNTWTLSQTFFSNIASANQFRGELSMTNDGSIFASVVSYNPSVPVTRVARVEIFTYSNSNANYSLTQTILGNTGSGGVLNPQLTSEPGYLFVAQGFNTEVYTCLS